MDATTIIAIYYYNGAFYLPTCVRSLAGMVGFTEPVAVIPAEDRAALVEAIELRAVAGNATVSNADFRATSDTVLLKAMHILSRQAFYTNTRRWSLVERDGAYTLIPYKAASIRGVVEDTAHAIPLNAPTFARDATEHLLASR